MRNNLRIKMFALIMAIVMLLCTMPAFAAEEGDDTETVTAEAPKTTVVQKLILNEFMDTSYSLKTAAGAKVDNISLADRSQDYHLIINVDKTPNIVLPAKGTFYYQLPEEIKSATNGTYGNVTWTYDATSNQLVLLFTPNVESNQEAFVIDVQVRLGNVYDLYNIAKIGNLYYRMDKTKIETKKTMYEYIGNSGQGVDNKVDASEYTAAEYDFGDITMDGVTYVYRPLNFKPAETETIDYYTAKLQYVTAVKGKIGGMNGNSPRWLSGIEYYKDSNATDSFHRNYEIKTYKHVGKEPEVFEQTLYNMLQVGTSNDYYRLKKSTIKALDVNKYGENKQLTKDQYELTTMPVYDFTNVTLTIDGETYEYSPTVKEEEEYTSYYTVSFLRLYRKNRVNGNEAWYHNPDGYLDGSISEFAEDENSTVGFHRDYVATLYKGTKKRELGVVLSSSIAGMTEVYAGTEVVLTAQPIGFEGLEYRVEWEYETPDGKVHVIEGEHNLTYTYRIDAENAQYTYTVALTPVK